MNTLKNASFRFVIFKENDQWHGAALEANIVKTGSTPEEVLLLLNEAMTGYFLTAQDIKDESILNQEPDPEYIERWEEGNATPAPANIFEAGRRNLIPA
jgi:predicted RNase H-like HicB family nuclease